MNLKHLLVVSLLANLILAGTIAHLANTISKLPDCTSGTVVYGVHPQPPAGINNPAAAK